MGIIRILAALALFLSAGQSMAARDYKEEGYLQCSAANYSNMAPVILFVNGIQNDLTAAEESRKKIEEVLSRNCVDCDFKKVYNKDDGMLHDVAELGVVSGWQLDALNQTARAQYKMHEITARKNIFKPLRDKGYETFDGYSLEVLQEELTSILQSRREGLKYVPQTDGSSFAGMLIAKNTAEITNPETRPKIRAALKLYQVYLREYKEVVDARFSFMYRSSVMATYYSNRNLYENDAKMSGAVAKSVESLVTVLTEYVLAGRKVVVVAHSQGNHIIDLAYSLLSRQRDNGFMNAIRVAGFASVSSVTPNNVYSTWNGDHTVLAIFPETGGSPLQPNFINGDKWNDLSTGDIMHHSFNDVYLSQGLKGKFSLPANAHGRENFSENLRNANREMTARDVFLDIIQGSIKSAVARPPVIFTGAILTAQLRWEDYGDMDLHISEPNNVHVNYRSKRGVYGNLDLDDRDGSGPEHYYTNENTKCEELNGKTWYFSIHQYPRGGEKAIVHFMIKIGDSAYLSRSFGIAKWPASILDVGSVRFQKEPTHLGGRVKYEITITDPNGV